MHHRSLGLALALLGPAAALAQTPTNTLVLIADDVGIDSINTYRAVANPPPTPNLDALATSGVLFRNALANPLCSPTRAAIHTGRYGFRTGIGTVVPPAGVGLPLSERTLPEVLVANGIRCALLGKWHLGTGLGADSPNQHGWQHYSGSLGAAVNDYYSWAKTTNGVTAMSTTYATTDAVNSALTWIGAQPAGWVCVVAFQSAHTPLHAPPAGLHTQNLAGLNPGTTPLPFYKAMVQAMDTEIGRLLASLDVATRARTNVIFMGDNGTPGNVTQAPFVRTQAKGTLYEGGTHVPLLVAGPAVVSPGREVSALIDPSDLFATICALHGLDARAQVPANVALDSISFAPLLANPSAAPPRAIAHVELFDFSATTTGHAVRGPRWKLIRFTDAGARDELYDLAADPQERANLFDGSLSAEQQTAYEELRLAAARLRGEPLALGYGSGCGGAAGTPTFTASSGPRVGATFAPRLAGLAPAANAAFALLGASRTQLGAVPLPIDLAVVGMPSCALQTSAELTLAMPTPSLGASSLTLGVPPDASLVGVQLFVQAFALEAAANVAGVIHAAPLAAVVGA